MTSALLVDNPGNGRALMKLCSLRRGKLNSQNLRHTRVLRWVPGAGRQSTVQTPSDKSSAKSVVNECTSVSEARTNFKRDYHASFALYLIKNVQEKNTDFYLKRVIHVCFA